MHYFAASFETYKRLPTREVNVGGLLIGNFNSIKVQTMTTTDTMDTLGTVEQTIKAVNAGAELVRITAPSKKEAENLKNIKDELIKRGYKVPLVADIHYTPNAAEVAARLIEKVRINPGNYVDKKKFETIEYTDLAYVQEIEKIRKKFVPLIKICKEYGTAMRIGTNHGSLSDRIMSRYGDTAIGMVESAMEFLRIARNESYHNIVLSMKSSNPIVMVEAYRLLAQTMYSEFGDCYPLHLGVTEAGDGEDGRVKSAVGIGTLLEDGIGDTIRVSLTEDPEEEIPVCQDLIKRYNDATLRHDVTEMQSLEKFSLNHQNDTVKNIGGNHVPIVIADLSKIKDLSPSSLEGIGYDYDEKLDKWHIKDLAADYIYKKEGKLNFEIPGTLNVLLDAKEWIAVSNGDQYFPLFDISEYLSDMIKSDKLNFVMISSDDINNSLSQIEKIKDDKTVVFALYSEARNAVQSIRKLAWMMENKNYTHPKIIIIDSKWDQADEHLLHYATECGALLIDTNLNGICLGMSTESYHKFSNHLGDNIALAGRNYHKTDTVEQFINTTAFSILQAARKRITKTEYISCPSCGRTLFDLQETTAMIRQRTHHLKGVKIGIMGCIVNGPGEMADADFGYVGSGVGKITLYKGQEVVKRNVDSAVAVDELIELMKENGAWVEP